MRSLAPPGGIATRGGAPATFAGCNNRPVACRAAAVACRAASTALPRQACRVTPLFATRRPSAAAARAAARRAARTGRGGLVSPRADIGGEYIENYDDVDRMMLNYFTYKAVRMTLAQLVETDTSPGKQEYSWLYQFALDNPPSDGQRFVSELLAVREDFGDRILTQRLTVYRRWVKTFSPESFDNKIQANNRDLLVARLSATVNLSLEVADRECTAADGKSEPCPTDEGQTGTL